MSRNNINGSRSLSSASCNSIISDADDNIDNGMEELTITKNNRPSSTSTRTQKAKRIRFYHNGNKYFTGAVVAVGSERYRSFESLTTELTTLLMKSVTLPSGVRTVFSMDGKKVLIKHYFQSCQLLYCTKVMNSEILIIFQVSSLDDLEDGKEYVCAGKGEIFKKIEYSKTDHNKSKRLSSGRLSSTVISQPRIAPPDCVRPRIVTLIRNGIKPRKVGHLYFIFFSYNFYLILQLVKYSVQNVTRMFRHSNKTLNRFIVILKAM